jgi:hypothetical protein
MSLNYQIYAFLITPNFFVNPKFKEMSVINDFDKIFADRIKKDPRDLKSTRIKQLSLDYLFSFYAILLGDFAENNSLKKLSRQIFLIYQENQIMDN